MEIQEKKHSNELVMSYYSLRYLIGILGMTLPLIVIIGNYLYGENRLQDSISAYYYTNMGDFFVGHLFAVGFLLITYRGNEFLDNVITTLSGLGAFGIAVFPMGLKGAVHCNKSIFSLSPGISDILHNISAGVFFILVASVSMFLFTRTSGNNPTKQKIIRNIIYRSCGLIIILAVLSVLILYHFKITIFKDARPILLMETIALLAFGISWIIKGEALFKDKL